MALSDRIRENPWLAVVHDGAIVDRATALQVTPGDPHEAPGLSSDGTASTYPDAALSAARLATP